MWGLFLLVPACDGGKDDSGPPTACETAGRPIEDRYAECGIEIQGDTGGTVECTEELVAQLECMTPCVEAAACDVLAQTTDDMEAVLAYSDCVTGCT